MVFKSEDFSALKCLNCQYKVIKPYPKNMICPKCGKNILKKNIDDNKKKGKKQKKKKKVNATKQEEKLIVQPKSFETQTTTLSSKLQGKVKVKKKAQILDTKEDEIELQKGEYIKLLGIVSVERTPLFSSNENYMYLLELANNLDFIATSILGGELDKMLLISEDDKEEKCQFFTKNKIIYIIYGSFPDKKGKWILEQMSKHYSELILGKNIDQLEKYEKYQIETKFNRIVKYILEEYLKMQEIFSDQDLPYVEDNIRIDYFGLSSKSIGVVSVLLGDDLNVESPGIYDDIAEELEMKESVLTAKIEAIAANTIGNTQAMPKWIAVRLSFQNYRFLTFKKLENDYFLYYLSEGNLNKVQIAEDYLAPYLSSVTDKSFSGNLKPFNRLKLTLKEVFNRKRVFS